MNKHILLVMKWLDDKNSVTQEELKENADAERWVNTYFERSGEDKQDYVDALKGAPPQVSGVPPTPEPVSRDNVLNHLGLILSSWPTNIREDKSLAGCGGWLWTMINGLPAAYCPTKELHIHRDEWLDDRVVPAMPATPTTVLHPGDIVEADWDGEYWKATVVGPHPHPNGQFIFITEGDNVFISSKFRPVKTECEVVVSAALDHLGYDAGQFEIDGSGDDPDICEELIKLFKAGYLSEPK